MSGTDTWPPRPPILKGAAGGRFSTSAPSAPLGAPPTAQPAPPTPQAMVPVDGMGGTEVRGLRLAAGVARPEVQLVAGAGGGSGH